MLSPAEREMREAAERARRIDGGSLCSRWTVGDPRRTGYKTWHVDGYCGNVAQQVGDSAGFIAKYIAAASPPAILGTLKRLTELDDILRAIEFVEVNSGDESWRQCVVYNGKDEHVDGCRLATALEV